MPKLAVRGWANWLSACRVLLGRLSMALLSAIQFCRTEYAHVLAAFLPAPPPLPLLTLIQLPILIPYCWIRDLHYLGYPMLWRMSMGLASDHLHARRPTLVNNAAENTAPPLVLARFGFGTLLSPLRPLSRLKASASCYRYATP